MTAGSVEVTSAAEEASIVLPRICHYGTGKFADSPVVLTFPPGLLPSVPEGRTMLARLDFALALREAYGQATSAEEVRNLSRYVEELAAHWRRGRYSHHDLLQLDLLPWLKSLVPRFRPSLQEDFPSEKTVEEDLLDSLGLLAAAGDLAPGAAKPTDFDSTWLDMVRVFDRRRALQDSLLALGAGGGAAAWVGASSTPEAVWLFGLVVFFLRFSVRLSTKWPDLTLLEYYSWEQCPKGEHKKLERAIAKGARGEEVLEFVAEARRERALAAEVAALQEKLTEELSPLTTPEERPSFLAAAQAAAAVEASPSWDLLHAQRELLAEVRALKASELRGA